MVAPLKAAYPLANESTNTVAAVPVGVKRDFSTLNLESAFLKLKEDAPTDRYVYYLLPKGWHIINSKFWEDINLKLNECRASEKHVTPVVEKIITTPPPVIPVNTLPWYKEPTFLIWGIPTAFVSGILVGIWAITAKSH